MSRKWDYFDRVAIIARALHAANNGPEDICVFMAIKLLWEKRKK